MNVSISISSVFSMLFPVIGVIETTDVSPGHLQKLHPILWTSRMQTDSQELVNQIKSVSLMMATFVSNPNLENFPHASMKKKIIHFKNYDNLKKEYTNNISIYGV